MTDTKDFPGYTLHLGPLEITWRSLFVARITYSRRSLTGSRAPLFERLRTQQETEPPWRRGHGAILRIWPTSRAVMLGWWGDPIVGDEAGDSRGLYEAIGVGDKQFVPITKLLGRATEEETVQRAAEQILGEPSDEDLLADDDFVVIDMRDDDDAVSG